MSKKKILVMFGLLIFVLTSCKNNVEIEENLVLPLTFTMMFDNNPEFYENHLYEYDNEMRRMAWIQILLSDDLDFDPTTGGYNITCYDSEGNMIANYAADDIFIQVIDGYQILNLLFYFDIYSKDSGYNLLLNETDYVVIKNNGKEIARTEYVKFDLDVFDNELDSNVKVSDAMMYTNISLLKDSKEIVYKDNDVYDIKYFYKTSSDNAKFLDVHYSDKYIEVDDEYNITPLNGFSNYYFMFQVEVERDGKVYLEELSGRTGVNCKEAFMDNFVEYLISLY